MTKPFELDPYAVPGSVLIRTADHRTFVAETMAMADLFVTQLDSDQVVYLPELTESTLDEQREQRIARVLARIVVDGIADAAIARSAAIAAHLEAAFA